MALQVLAARQIDGRRTFHGTATPTAAAAATGMAINGWAGRCDRRAGLHEGDRLDLHGRTRQHRQDDGRRVTELSQQGILRCCRTVPRAVINQ